MLNSIKPRTSARKLVAPISAPVEPPAARATARRDNLTPAEFSAAYQRIYSLRQNGMLRKQEFDELGRCLIAACIAEGIDTWPRIRGILGKMRLDTGRLETILIRHTGDDPEIHWWQRQTDGTFRVHDEP